MESTAPRKAWTRDDLVVACGLYFTLPFGRMHARNPAVIEVASLLGRTPGSVAMKLVNFASLDPAQQERGIKGLSNSTQADREVWESFRRNWDEMTLQSENDLEQLRSQLDTSGQIDDATATQTERQVPAKIRLTQRFFRKAVLAAYDTTCCISGNPVDELLVASHILPWSRFPEERMNPRNGLCLAATYDRAFDRGLISFDDTFRMVLSPALKRFLPNPIVQSDFQKREGQALRLPDRFAPEARFIAYHRENIFRFKRSS